MNLFPWICGREFTPTNPRELTVHHKNHHHDHNPADGSNWELLCLYCHDNEHRRYLEAARGKPGTTEKSTAVSRHLPFVDLAEILKRGR